MAKDKERSVNPAAAQRKAEKQKAIKKNKTSTQALRNEKLARRNPERLQTQINDLKALESKGDLKPREKSILDELEKDLRAVKKAREALGDKAPRFGSGTHRREGDGNVLGKRRHDGERKEFEEPDTSETDEDVRRIPMPRDTPPPIPREYRQKPRVTNANNEPLGSDRSLPAQPTAPAQTTYSSAPQIRDLKQEAVKRFIPTIVRQKQQAVKGIGGLVEPEELDRLEAEGYGVGGAKRASTTTAADAETSRDAGPEGTATLEAEAEARRLEEEEERFRREMAMDEDVVQEGQEDGEKMHEEDPAAAVAAPVQAEPREESQDVVGSSNSTVINKTRRPLQPLVEDVSDEDI